MAGRRGVVAFAVTLLLAAIPASIGPALAAGVAGDAVPAFGSCGMARVSLPLDNGEGLAMVASVVSALPDGRMVVAGSGDVTISVVGLYRLLADGSLDASFGRNGGVVTPLTDPSTGVATNAHASAMVVQPDGRIVVAASSYVFNRRTDLVLLRFLADGRPDPSFGTSGQVTYENGPTVGYLAVQPDGKLVGAGGRTVVRFDQAGRPDVSFGSAGTVTLPDGWGVGDVALQRDGRIVLGLTLWTNTTDFGLTRLLPDGLVDPTFGNAGLATTAVTSSWDYLTAIAIDGAGRIVSTGSASAGQTSAVALTRHLSGGQLDPTFGDGGIAVTPMQGTYATGAVDVVVQPDGKPVAAVAVQEPPVNGVLGADLAVERLTSGGRLDSSFGSNGVSIPRVPGGVAFPTSMAASGDGGWLVGAGVPREPVGGVVRVRGDGASSLDNLGVTAQTCARSAALTADGPSTFGTRVVHTSSGVRTFTLTSTGTRAVRVNRVGPSDTTGEFVVRSTTCVGAQLAPGASCSISVAFAPTAPGVYSRAVVAWDDAGFSSQAAFIDGTALATPVGWGWNGYGQLGSGAGVQSLIAGAPSGLGAPVAISAGYNHTLALLDAGVVYAWGWNHFGQLGVGAERTGPADQPRPSLVSVGARRVNAVAAGGFHSLALLDDGTVVSWGLNNVGQLGNGRTDDQVVPYPVAGLTGVVAISAGIYHSVAVKSDGTVWAWGWNHFGQLGDGTATDHSVPTRVPGLTGVTAVAAGGYHSLALVGGSVRAWGFNDVGQLGDGSTVDRPSPVAVPGLGDVTKLAAGAFHTLALSGDGGVSTWGWNAFGQLGDGTTADRASPRRVTTGTAVAGGLGHSLALQPGGSVTSWGWNVLGQLGDGTTTTRLGPVTVVGMAGATSVTAGALHSVAN